MDHTDVSIETLLWECQRLRAVEAVAQSMQTSQDLAVRCETALHTLNTCVPAMALCIHWADVEHKTLHMLAHVACGVGYLANMQQIRLDRAGGETWDIQQCQSVLVEDLVAAGSGPLDIEAVSSALPGVRSYCCVPLWFEDVWEGTLLAFFAAPLAADAREVVILSSCTSYVAAALARERPLTHLTREHRRLLTILDQMPGGALIAEATSGTITYINAMGAQLLGYPEQSLVGKPFHTCSDAPAENSDDLRFDRPLCSWNFALTRALCGEGIHAQETLVTRRDGERRFLLCSSAPLPEADGEVREALLIFQDISSPMQLDQQRSAFVALVSHELRLPVTVIEGFTDLLLLLADQGQALTESVGKHALDTILQQCENLVHLLDGMMDLTHLGRGSLSIHPTMIDIVAFLRSFVEISLRISPSARIDLVVKGLKPDEPLQGLFDEGRLKQILHNLLSNALKYSPAETEVELGVRWNRVRPGEILLWVRDEGIGIPEDDLPYIFQRYYRARTHARNCDGLGLGLFLVKELVTRLGGHIWVTSHIGKGSTFFLRFPLQQR